jgi:hypothetical protein
MSDCDTVLGNMTKPKGNLVSHERGIDSRSDHKRIFIYRKGAESGREKRGQSRHGFLLDVTHSLIPDPFVRCPLGAVQNRACAM